MQDIKFPVSLKIEKKGKMVYFSQLDLSLTLKRALRRTDLPNYFTKGFRPHIKVSFKGALKLGEQGNLPLTFYFKKRVDPEKVIIKLNFELPEGLKIKKPNE
ncbi:MAG: TIGR03936 family radical SAM-associated protein [Candidatus Omnitrophica bacterium]|nr:TIGR03936 family radical SAM-associated protein [Candidatus Omnitrophota bacterium]MCF7894250.1 TIGR03936 family radical SAM-associated protein [Candidatus Omnitrophota bacterium]